MSKLEKRRAYLKERRARVCESCGGPKEIAGYCRSCYRRRETRRKQLWVEKKTRNECISCNRIVSTGKSKCEICLKKQREQRAKREITRFNGGLCIKCGKLSHTLNSKTCGNCFCRNVSKFHFNTYSHTDDLMNLLVKQDHKCPYTGRKLTLGENCTLDHIVPKSRGGKNELSNLQWVYYLDHININTIKWTMTDEEFKKLILEVSIHLGA